MYGFRIIIPLSIGLTRYSAKKYAIINLISGMCWASVTILLAWYFGEEIWEFVKWAENHWYLAIPIIAMIIWLLFSVFKNIEKKILNQREEKNEF